MIHLPPIDPCDLGRRASAAVRAAGGTPMQALDAAIAATFGPYNANYRRKQAVRRIIRLGGAHPEVRARFGRYADQLRGYYHVDVALQVVHGWYVREGRRQAGIALLWGREIDLRDACGALWQARVILRVIRRYAPASALTPILEAVRGYAVMAEAAE